MKKIFLGIVYAAFSVIWLYLSVVFASALWLERPGTKEWQEDAMFIPIGIVMLVFWAASLVMFIIAAKSKKRIDNDPEQ